jgi:hypothetical protein
VPALLRAFGRGFFLRNRHFGLLTRDDLSFATRDDLSFALPGASKLDGIGGIVNMSRSYPALRLAALQSACDDVR